MVETVDIAWTKDLSIFASEPYLKNEGFRYGWVGSRAENGNLQCVLPYVLIRKYVFKLVRFTSETIYLGDKIDAAAEKCFLNGVVEHFRSSGAHAIIPPTFNSVFNAFPDNAVVAPFGSYVIDMNRSEEELLRGLHPKHRNVIKGAQKKGVKVVVGNSHWETAYRLVRESFMRSAGGLIGRVRVASRLDSEFFRKQVESFGEYVRIFIAEHDGVAQGCAVIPFSNHCAYYMHGGSTGSPVTGAMNLIHWEAIRQFRDMGVRRYDFFGGRVRPEPGSKIEGIMKFKERFGGRFIQGYTWKVPLEDRMYKLYSAAALLRSGGDLVDQEKHKLQET